MEILVAADLVRTVAVEPTWENVLILGVIVLIRTLLSFSLEIELEGTLPWRRNSAGQEVTAAAAPGTPSAAAPPGAPADQQAKPGEALPLVAPPAQKPAPGAPPVVPGPTVPAPAVEQPARWASSRIETRE